MEIVVGSKDLQATYRNKNVLVTGHTGFKGSWLARWLAELGARVFGYALAPNSTPSHHDLLNPPFRSELNTILNYEALLSFLQETKPEIVFHLAAQPLVIESYKNPLETFHTNISGTANLLEACRHTDSVKAVVIISSDKCYQNKEWIFPYRETDRLGGFDPYSASKACTEIITESYRNSFFPVKDYNHTHQVLLASARAGNVIGGGDWAAYRLVPDIVRAAFSNQKVVIRSPMAIRPWQHVLEPLYGYLLLGRKLLLGDTAAAQAWNFGATPNESYTVEQMVMFAQKIWPRISFEIQVQNNAFHEAGILKLDSSMATNLLGWKPRWSHCAIENTIQWYREYYESGKIITDLQLKLYLQSLDVNE